MVGVGGGWLVLKATGSLSWMFLTLAIAFVVYGVMVAAAIAGGAWFKPRRGAPAVVR